MPLIKQHPLRSNKDERGFAWFPFEDCQEVKESEMMNFHYAELKPGAVRGGHYHVKHTEYTLVSGTSIKITLEDLQGNKEEHRFGESPDILFEIPPKIKHTIENTGTGTNHLIGFFTGPDNTVKTIKP